MILLTCMSIYLHKAIQYKKVLCWHVYRQSFRYSIGTFLSPGSEIVKQTVCILDKQNPHAYLRIGALRHAHLPNVVALPGLCNEHTYEFPFIRNLHRVRTLSEYMSSYKRSYRNSSTKSMFQKLINTYESLQKNVYL
jgi:hypothetical protein